MSLIVSKGASLSRRFPCFRQVQRNKEQAIISFFQAANHDKLLALNVSCRNQAISLTENRRGP